ncbi:NADPH:quinone reductase [Lentilitoribacter sp. Alg239-R112]|uniref:NADPH:quinone reductase n=1 Tax=Lentilitoribacter sp. Alg239-R112 TaxID=2305987 RepID=UPI0013A6E30D|nr:NADPH:quinone reductase [Lentilitoribacter sp. Alg239-R112]
MRAICVNEFGDADVLQIENKNDPIPAANEVVIDMMAAGVNPADTYTRTGTYIVKPELPYTPGGDAAGVISSVGATVRSLKVGDRVATGIAFSSDRLGCYAEKILRNENDVIKIPDRVSFAQATALGVSYPTAHHALFNRGRLTADETVFIHGASGSVGTSAIQLAKRAGAKIIGSAGTQAGLTLLKSQGVDLAVNHSSGGYADEIMAFTNGDGVDLTLEMLANVNLATDLDLAAMFGRIVIIGNRGEITINPRMTMAKELDVMGMALWNLNAEQIKPIMDDLIIGLADGSLTPITGKEIPLADAALAHEYVLAPGAHGKVILVP